MPTFSMLCPGAHSLIINVHLADEDELLDWRSKDEEKQKEK
jgi:hypothetical protein